jgi:chromosome segregation ATPase
LLDELKAKVQGEVAKEEMMMEEYTKWCDAEENTKTDAITSATRTIKDLSATIEEATGKISTLSAEVDELAAKISTGEADLASATSIREEEKSAFDANEKELLDTSDSLERALVVIKRGQTGFLQTKDGAEVMKRLAAGLKPIVDASWITSAEKAKVQALLQSQSDDDDLSLKDGDGEAPGIVETLTDLRDKAKESLSKARRAEMEQAHQYELLKQSIEMELGTMKDRMSAAVSERSGTEEVMHAASADLEETKKSKATDEAYLEDLKVDCATKAKEWDARQKTVTEELGAIAKAKEILSEGVKVFLQERSSNDATKRDEVTKILRNLAKNSHEFAFSQLASEAQSDAFAKIRGMIEGMIDRLMKEAAEEADAKAFCDVEMDKSRTKQRELSSKVDMHAVRIEKSESGIAKLKSAIQTLQVEIAAIDSGTKEATELRTNQKAEFDETSAEYKQSADAVANAIQVLQSYYSQGSFVQRDAPEFGGAKSDIGATIISMLEVAESEFTELLAEATAAENQAVAAFDKLASKNKLARTAKTEEIKGKESEVKSLEMSLLNYKEDKEATGKELDAVLKYLDKLKPQCETKVVSYAERVAKREQEIAGLKEALTILEAA